MVRIVQLFVYVRDTLIWCRCNFFEEVLSEVIARQIFPKFFQNFESKNYAAKFSYGISEYQNHLCFASYIKVNHNFWNIEKFQNFTIFETQKIMDQKLVRQPNSYKKGFENSEILKFFDLGRELYGVKHLWIV